MKRRAPDRPPEITLRLPLDGATAAALLDLCGQLSEALLRQWGDEIEAHCLRRGIHYVPVVTDTAWDRLVLFQLRRQGLIK